MPSVGSTPTTTSPAQHQTPPPPPIMTTPPPLPQPHRKLRQHSLPLHLQYPSSGRGGGGASHSSYAATHHPAGVRTTQPSPAGTFVSHHPQPHPHHHCTSSDYCGCGGLGGPMTNGGGNGGGGADDMDDLSPISSSNSFSSVDTNQTLLNNIAAANQQQTQPHHHKPTAKAKERADSSSGGAAPPTHHQPTSHSSKRATHATNRSYRTKYGQFMIITPAVSIDPDCANAGSGAAAEQQQQQSPKPQQGQPGGGFDDNGGAGGDDDDPYFNNGNIFRMSLLQSSIDSGNSSDTSSFHSQYNPYIHTSRQHLLPKSAPHFYTFSSSSWRWCTLICAAMRCFGAGRNGGGGGAGQSSHASTSAYNSFSRAPYQRTNGHSGKGASAPHRRLKPSSSFTAETAFEHFSAPFKTRKTRDHLNNITYEL